VYKVHLHFILSTDHPHSRTTTMATRRAHSLFAIPDTVNHHGRAGVQGTLAFLPFLLYLLPVTPFPEQQQRQQRAGVQVRSHFPFISLYIPTTYTSQTISTGDRCRRQQECPLPDALLLQLNRSPHPSLHETQDGGFFTSYPSPLPSAQQKTRGIIPLPITTPFLYKTDTTQCYSNLLDLLYISIAVILVNLN